MKSFITATTVFFSRWFHKRNIIIVSERKVKHIPVGGHVQFGVLLLAMVGVCWASYSTGSYIAARSALKEQGQALRTVTNAHIESSFSSVFQPAVKTKPSVDVGPYKSSLPRYMPDGGPIAALSALDNAKLVARITLLESKVIELKNTNEAIVQRVQDKTSGKLEDLESIIKQTGLSANELKKQYTESKNKTGRSKQLPSEGGPYIPAETSLPMPVQAKEMFSDLDDLIMLTQIVSELPLGKPLAHYEEHSGFGHRIDPFNGHLAFHSGIDLAAGAGAKILSTADGKVTSAGRNGAYGNAVDIQHSYGISTRYAHLSQVLVQENQMVKKGDVIGIQGSTGRSTGNHLHYEVRYRDHPMNPKNFLEVKREIPEE